MSASRESAAGPPEAAGRRPPAEGPPLRATQLAVRADATPAVRPGSGKMFDRIARRYDLLNRILSLGLDQRWRRLTVAALELSPGRRVLDLATGTGDLALAMLKGCPEIEVVGVDPSAQMLARAREKLGERNGRALGVGDAEALPFADGCFDAVAIAFGLRNVPDRERGLREMARVTRKGGVVAILELGEPRGRILGRLARFHVHVVVPRVGALLSGAPEYRYLEKSIAAFPPPDQVLSMMRRSGLEDVAARPLSFGVCHLYTGRSTGAAGGRR